jgi:hypothetical protein
MNILISGGSGLVGAHLSKLLTEKGHQVAILSRSAKSPSPYRSFVWNPEKGIFPTEALENTEVIIHLAGAGIADHRWSPSYKEEILKSRTESANLIFRSLKNNKHRVHTFISSSAVGFYGDCGDAWIDELRPPADDFMGKVCEAWERSAIQFETLGIRVARIRTGVVLANGSGALPVLARTVKLFAGAPLGNGQQYIPWIHINDLSNIYLFAIDNKTIHGAYNASAPSPVTNKHFTELLGRVLHRPIWPIAVPGFLLKLILGEKAVVVLNGQRTTSEKIRLAGFHFQFTDAELALKDLLDK